MNPVFTKLVYFILVLGLASCSKKVTTNDLADALSHALQSLPSMIRQVNNEESAHRAIQQIDALKKEVIHIVSQVKKGEVLTSDKAVFIDVRLRDIMDEVAYVMQGLSAHPELILKLEDPLLALSKVLSVAEKRMKGHEST